MVWSIRLFIMLGAIRLIMCSKIKVGMIVMVTTVPAVDSISAIWASFKPMTFCPLISQMWWSVRRPFLAAELSFTMDVIFPLLKIKPTCPLLSLCIVTVRSKGLSRIVMVIFSPNACLSTLCALSELQPAQFSPLIWSTWSPNLSPTKEAGELAWTSWTNIPGNNIPWRKVSPTQGRNLKAETGDYGWIKSAVS